MASLGTLTYQGKSGKDYAFSVYTFGTEFKALGAVYAISSTEMEGNTRNHNCIYFGVTGDLSERFNDHHKAKDFKKNNATHISILVENDETKRLSIEKDLITNYNPKCNEIHNSK